VKISYKEDVHICRTNFAKKMERNSHEITSWWKMYGKQLFFEDLEVQDDAFKVEEEAGEVTARGYHEMVHLLMKSLWSNDNDNSQKKYSIVTCSNGIADSIASIIHAIDDSVPITIACGALASAHDSITKFDISISPHKKSP
jgi:hypothetical protein